LATYVKCSQFLKTKKPSFDTIETSKFTSYFSAANHFKEMHV
jgi:hypothetical protein